MQVSGDDLAATGCDGFDRKGEVRGGADRCVRTPLYDFRERESELAGQFEVVDVPTIGMVKQGKFHPFVCNGTFEDLRHFATLGYPQVPPRPILKPKSALERAKHAVWVHADSWTRTLNKLGLAFLPSCLKLLLLLCLFLAPIALAVLFCLKKPISPARTGRKKD